MDDTRWTDWHPERRASCSVCGRREGCTGHPRSLFTPERLVRRMGDEDEQAGRCSACDRLGPLRADGRPYPHKNDVRHWCPGAERPAQGQAARAD